MITGSVTGLRAIEPEDLERLREWRNRPENRRYFREYREIGPSDQGNWYDRVCNDNRVVMFGIVRLDNDWLIGAAGLCDIDWYRRSAEVSLYIGEGYIDDQYAPDVLDQLLKIGFDNLGLQRLWTEVYEFDTPKKDLLHDADFLKEGTLRNAHWEDGRWYDSHIYGLVAYDYKEERRWTYQEVPSS